MILCPFLFAHTVGAYRDQEEERRKIRNAEKDRQKSSLLAKLAESKRKNRDGTAEGDMVCYCRKNF